MAVAIRWMSSAERLARGWTTWSEVVEFSSLLTLSSGLAGGVEFMTPLRILRNTTEQLVKAMTFSWLRYTTNAKPAFRFQYVHAYCQLVDQPGKHFCDETLTCNDACVYLTQKRVSTIFLTCS